ncbi:hypothetical protein QBC47DRAFT_369761 [Echria macrotheca]|uniref:Uncharacterized protein n=1 Tax=Echria macrotheca TaxID=438768 RepID=A0AAJ0BQL8_9PEZI|nr:hypothetical protein QBC47DRAFT_369761 [Echria macrotheca]
MNFPRTVPYGELFACSWPGYIRYPWFFGKGREGGWVLFVFFFPSRLAIGMTYNGFFLASVCALLFFRFWMSRSQSQDPFPLLFPFPLGVIYIYLSHLLLEDVVCVFNERERGEDGGAGMRKEWRDDIR